jgi:hypothetical protein
MARARNTAEALPVQEGVRTPIVTAPEALRDIEKLEDSLWEAADNLRANSKLTSSEYCMPVLGVPRWTVQIRPFMVTAKAAIPSERSRPSQFYFTPFPVGKSACTFVRQLRGPHLSTCA